jgi:hypothetical protein
MSDLTHNIRDMPDDFHIEGAIDRDYINPLGNRGIIDYQDIREVQSKTGRLYIVTTRYGAEMEDPDDPADCEAHEAKARRAAKHIWREQELVRLEAWNRLDGYTKAEPTKS